MFPISSRLPALLRACPITALLPLLEHTRAWLHTATSFYGRGNRVLS